VITYQLLHKQALKYFMTNKCVVLLCSLFVYRGFSTASDYAIFYKICVITSNITPLNAEFNPICHLLVLLGDSWVRAS
jgi:hypothetical protein